MEHMRGLLAWSPAGLHQRLRSPNSSFCPANVPSVTHRPISPGYTRVPASSRPSLAPDRGAIHPAGGHPLALVAQADTRLRQRMPTPPRPRMISAETSESRQPLPGRFASLDTSAAARGSSYMEGISGMPRGTAPCHTPGHGPCHASGRSQSAPCGRGRLHGLQGQRSSNDEGLGPDEVSLPAEFATSLRYGHVAPRNSSEPRSNSSSDENRSNCPGLWIAYG